MAKTDRELKTIARNATVGQVEHAIWAVYGGKCPPTAKNMPEYQAIVDCLTCLPDIFAKIRQEYQSRIDRLAAELSHLQALGCSDCSSRGHDGSNPCASCFGRGCVGCAQLQMELEMSLAAKCEAPCGDCGGCTLYEARRNNSKVGYNEEVEENVYDR